MRLISTLGRRALAAAATTALSAATMALAVAATTAIAANPTTGPDQPNYKDDPAIVKQLDGLKAGQSLRLPAVTITGDGIAGDRFWSKNTPGVRDYCNKLAYAPDRRTAMYAGANHQSPSRLNDCWEYHLGSNTWVRLSAPDGGDHGDVRRAQNQIKKGQDVEKAKQFLTRWFTDNLTVRDGYLQTKVNGGPVCPWHTWDALAYDPTVGRLFWAVLDTDNVLQNTYGKLYAEYSGQDFDTVAKQFKPGTGLYGYDPAKGRWFRQIGQDPRPYLRGMGGSMLFVPQWNKLVWYCAAQNVSPNDFAMWTYDAKANRWAELRPNNGRPVRELAAVDKVAPMSECQMAYSAKHRKIVAVNGPDTFAYDIDTNAWSKLASDPQNQAHDAVTVFAYDSNADLFLLVNCPEGRWKPTRELRAFSLADNTWRTLPIDGPNIDRKPYRGQAGYYDPQFNVLVVYDSGNDMWVYRVKETASRKPADH